MMRHCATYLVVVLLLSLISGQLAPAGLVPPLSYDYGLDREAEQVAPGCLPPLEKYAEPTIIEYSANLVRALTHECLVENATQHNAIKYGALTLATAAGLLAPQVGAVAGAYMGDELSSDVQKCVIKSFIEASSSLTASEKNQLKNRIEGLFMMKDWHGFVETLQARVPELSDPQHVRDVTVVINGLAGLYDRQAEAVEILDWATKATSSDTGAWYGEMASAVDKIDRAIDQCRFLDAATLYLAAARRATATCQDLALKYRLAEARYRQYYQKNIKVLQWIESTYNDRDPVLQETRRLYRHLIRRQNAFRRHLADRRKLQETYQALVPAHREFAKILERHNEKIVRIMALPSDRAVCQELEAVEKMYQDEVGRTPCRSAYFRNPPYVLSWKLDKIAMRLSTNGRMRSKQWWKDLQKIVRLYESCKAEETRLAVEELRGKIAENPTYLIRPGTRFTCDKISQTELLSRLDTITSHQYTPARCRDPWTGHWIALSYYATRKGPDTIENFTQTGWKWSFTVTRENGEYRIDTHTKQGLIPLAISPKTLIFKFNDRYDTHIQLTLVNDTQISGQVRQPKNPHPELRQGNVIGYKQVPRRR